MTDDVDYKRRDFLIKTLSVLGGIGVAATTIPFLKACQPSVAAALAAEPLHVDITDLQPGQLLTVEWHGMPIWIIRRTSQEIKQLAQPNTHLRDPHSLVDQQPSYAQNPYRSIKPEILVLIGLCTHLGCIPHLQNPSERINVDGARGFVCPCHGSTFDMAGRVFKNVPAPINLKVPPYTFINEHTLLIGSENVG